MKKKTKAKQSKPMHSKPKQKTTTWNKLNQQIAGCTDCPRLVVYCQEIAETKRKSFSEWKYWGRPVPNFGDSKAKILFVGLAPAAHGANRTGRMFTGDRSGDFLFEAMHAVGLCNQARSDDQSDGLELNNCAITAVCHCAPPANKPTIEEIKNCRPWLDQTIDFLNSFVFVALGQLAWNETLKVANERGWYEGKKPKFGHGEVVTFANESSLVGCYHPSQQNTFTGKLTQTMLRAVLRKAIRLAK